MKLFGYGFFLLVVFSGIVFAQERQQKIFTATVDADGVQRISMSGGEYFFEPNHIIVKVNMPVELSVKKTSGFVPHNIIIDAPEAGIEVKQNIGKDPVIIKFTPQKTGRYPFYCDKRFLFFKDHRERGMEGMLEVVD